MSSIYSVGIALDDLSGPTENISANTLAILGGSVGIGTASPVTDPVKLHVAGNIAVNILNYEDLSQTTRNKGLYFYDQNLSFGMDLIWTGTRYITAITAQKDSDIDGDIALGTYPGGATRQDAFTELMTIDGATGNVRIGDTTPDQGLKLDVQGPLGAQEYCDEDGANCKAITAISGGPSSCTFNGQHIVGSFIGDTCEDPCCGSGLYCFVNGYSSQCEYISDVKIVCTGGQASFVKDPAVCRCAGTCIDLSAY